MNIWEIYIVVSKSIQLKYLCVYLFQIHTDVSHSIIYAYLIEAHKKSITFMSLMYIEFKSLMLSIRLVAIQNLSNVSTYWRLPDWWKYRIYPMEVSDVYSFELSTTLLDWCLYVYLIQVIKFIRFNPFCSSSSRIYRLLNISLPLPNL